MSIGVVKKYSNFVGVPIYLNGKRINIVQVRFFTKISVCSMTFFFLLNLWTHFIITLMCVHICFVVVFFSLTLIALCLTKLRWLPASRESIYCNETVQNFSLVPSAVQTNIHKQML